VTAGGHVTAFPRRKGGHPGGPHYRLPGQQEPHPQVHEGSAAAVRRAVALRDAVFFSVLMLYQQLLVPSPATPGAEILTGGSQSRNWECITLWNTSADFLGSCTISGRLLSIGASNTSYRRAVVLPQKAGRGSRVLGRCRSEGAYFEDAYTEYLIQS